MFIITGETQDGQTFYWSGKEHGFLPGRQFAKEYKTLESARRAVFACPEALKLEEKSRKQLCGSSQKKESDMYEYYDVEDEELFEAAVDEPELDEQAFMESLMFNGFDR